MNKERKQELIEKLRKFCPAGSQVSVLITSVSGSGLSRTVRVVNHSNFDITDLVAELFETKYLGDKGFRVTGTGVDMRFYTIYQLSRALYGDGYELIWK